MLRCVVILVLLLGRVAHAQQASVFGDWREPSGSVIEVYHCGADVCLRLAEISPTAPARVDHNNPDKALRTRSLCGLNIGYGFHLKDESRAEDGKLYDPKSGNNYSGAMWVEDGRLHLHGYLHFKALGRTEVWERVAATPVCKA